MCQGNMYQIAYIKLYNKILELLFSFSLCLYRKKSHFLVSY